MSIPDRIELIIIIIATFVMLLAGSDLGLYIIGVLVMMFIMGIVMGGDHPLGSLARLMPTVFTPEGLGSLGAIMPYLHGIDGAQLRRVRASKRPGGLK